MKKIIYFLFFIGLIGMLGRNSCMQEYCPLQEFEKNPLVLHEACKRGRFGHAQKLVVVSEKVNIGDQMGWTPLHWAVLNEQADIARLLIAKDAQVNVKTHQGKTPLHFATYLQHHSSLIIELLLDKGASISMQDIKGCTPLHYAITETSHMESLKILLLYHYTDSLWPRDKDNRVPTLKDLCLNYIANRKKEFKASMCWLPEILRQEIDNRKLTYMKYVLTIKNNGSKTPRDLAVEKKNHAFVAFIDTILRATVLDNLEELGYEPKA